jgi:hypothetical protein
MQKLDQPVFMSQSRILSLQVLSLQVLFLQVRRLSRVFRAANRMETRPLPGSPLCSMWNQKTAAQWWSALQRKKKRRRPRNQEISVRILSIVSDCDVSIVTRTEALPDKYVPLAAFYPNSIQFQ